MGDLGQGVQSFLEANAKCGFSFRRDGKALEDCVDDLIRLIEASLWLMYGAKTVKGIGIKERRVRKLLQ